MFLSNASFIGGSLKQKKHMGFRRSEGRVGLNGRNQKGGTYDSEQTLRRHRPRLSL